MTKRKKTFLTIIGLIVGVSVLFLVYIYLTNPAIFGIEAASRQITVATGNPTPTMSRSYNKSTPPDRLYLQEGPQTKITSKVRQVANQIPNGRTTYETIRNIKNWEQNNLSNCSNYYRIRERTAEQIITLRCAGGCTDFTLVFAALARAKGIPATVTEVIGLQWVTKMIQAHKWINPIPGHFFSEVFIAKEKKWIIFDPTSGQADITKTNWGFFIGPPYMGSSRDNNGLRTATWGQSYLFFARGLDSWDYGIYNQQQFENTIKQRYNIK